MRIDRFLSFLIIMVLSACEIDLKEHQNEINIVYTLYQSVENEKYATLDSIYFPETMFAEQSKEEWINNLIIVQDSFGGIEGFEITERQYASSVDMTEILILEMKVIRQNKPTMETFKFVKLEGNRFNAIFDHDIRAE